jgi:hypothetical protein
MKTDKPYRKSFACGGVLYILVLCILLFGGAKLSAHQIGYLFSEICVLPALTTGIWGWFSKKNWTWLRFVVTFITFVIAFIMLSVMGQLSNYAQHP